MQSTGGVALLALAFLILFITIVPGGGYVMMKIWFYFLNSQFRKRSADIRDKLAKESSILDTKERAIFVGFFHPYWWGLPAFQLAYS
jgi:hypothetical protein